MHPVVSGYIRVRPLASNEPLSVLPSTDDKHVVICRDLRPKYESGTSGGALASPGGGAGVLAAGVESRTHVSGAFGGDASQRVVYDAVCRPLLAHALAGYHALCFGYGHTGSGKSYTLFGAASDVHHGFVPRMSESLFKAAATAQAASSTVQVFVSFYDVYNDSLRDLAKFYLTPFHRAHTAQATSSRIEKLKASDYLTEDLNVLTAAGGASGAAGTITIPDLTRIEVTNREQILEIVRSGLQARAGRESNVGSISNRAHTVLSIDIVIVERTAATAPAAAAGATASPAPVTPTPSKRVARRGRLVFVDMAGAEEITHSSTDGKAPEPEKQALMLASAAAHTDHLVLQQSLIQLNALASTVVSNATPKSAKSKSQAFGFKPIPAVAPQHQRVMLPSHSKLALVLHESFSTASRIAVLGCVDPHHTNTHAAHQTVHYVHSCMPKQPHHHATTHAHGGAGAHHQRNGSAALAAVASAAPALHTSGAFSTPSKPRVSTGSGDADRSSSTDAAADGEELSDDVIALQEQVQALRRESKEMAARYEKKMATVMEIVDSVTTQSSLFVTPPKTPEEVARLSAKEHAAASTALLSPVSALRSIRTKLAASASPRKGSGTPSAAALSSSMRLSGGTSMSAAAAAAAAALPPPLTATEIALRYQERHSQHHAAASALLAIAMAAAGTPIAPAAAAAPSNKDAPASLPPPPEKVIAAARESRDAQAQMEQRREWVAQLGLPANYIAQPDKITRAAISATQTAERRSAECTKLLQHANARLSAEEKRHVSEKGELRKRIAFLESRLNTEKALIDTEKAALTERHELALDTVRKQHLDLGAQHATHLNTLKQTATLMTATDQSIASVRAEAEANLIAERTKWAALKATELANLKSQYEYFLKKKTDELKKFVGEFERYKADRSTRVNAYRSELDILYEYVFRLTSVLERVDAGQYPVRSRYGITAFVIPDHERAAFDQFSIERCKRLKARIENADKLLAAQPPAIGDPQRPRTASSTAAGSSGLFSTLMSARSSLSRSGRPATGAGSSGGITSRGSSAGPQRGGNSRADAWAAAAASASASAQPQSAGGDDDSDSGDERPQKLASSLNSTAATLNAAAANESKVDAAAAAPKPRAQSASGTRSSFRPNGMASSYAAHPAFATGGNSRPTSASATKAKAKPTVDQFIE